MKKPFVIAAIVAAFLLGKNIWTYVANLGDGYTNDQVMLILSHSEFWGSYLLSEAFFTDLVAATVSFAIVFFITNRIWGAKENTHID